MRRIVLGILLVSAWEIRAEEKIAATVNGEAITLGEVDRAIANAPPPLTPPTTAQRRQQRMDVVQILADDRLVRQFLRDSGITVEASEVEKQYAALEASQVKEGKTMAGYCREIGQTPEQLKANFRQMLQLAKYIDGQTNDDKLKQYFEANRDFFDKTTVRVSHLILRMTPASTLASTANDRATATAKLKDLRESIVAKKLDFAAAAKENSHCPSAPKGGDLGFIVRKFQFDESFAKAAFALKVGEISDVVETDFGLHLILVTDRKPGKATRYDEVQPDVRECFEAEVRQNLLATLRKKAKIEITLP
jgi:parvulin-like peptidyl-prolyl isomerase